MAEKIEILVEGGKATPAPPLGPKLGELKMNVGQVITEINKKTADFKGMKVPVIIEIQKDKSYTITVGTPPTSQLIKKEIGIELGSGEPNKIKVANASIEQIIKVAKMKQGNMFTKDLKQAVKSVAGSLVSMGVLIEGKEPKEVVKEIDQGKYDKEIKEGRTEMSPEKAAEF
ncbi:MAG: 50S ribosomal protein L11, partial [Candidatus Nanoarchaeia archaeon]